MRILVHGAGAVGSYFGALLARAGNDTVLVARGEHLEALQRRGLRVERPDGPLAAPTLRAVATPRDAFPEAAPDLVLVCVKSYDTAAAAAALAPVVAPETIVLSLQNGIENEESLAARLGLPPLLVGLTRIGVERTGPGVVRYTGRGEILFGEPGGRLSPRARRLGETLAGAGIPHQLRRDVLVVAWEKLAWNAGFNAVTTLVDQPVGPVVARAETCALVRRAMEETDAVAAALGIAVRRRRLDAVLAESASEMPDFPTSMLQDRRRGTRLEHDALNGAVVRAGERAGVAVPVNRLLLGLLAGLSVG
ncbi:MAG: ketopantoate reductase family protein [bacterium]|nr:ketopantoate reductase family protein [bacterium]